jgi:hypothetical protein
MKIKRRIMNEMFRNLPDLKQIDCSTPECLLKERERNPADFRSK